MRKSAAYKIIDYLTTIIITLLVVTALISLFFLIQSRIRGQTPSLGGYQMYVVMSGSMSPAVETGSLVFVKPLDADEIKVQDIIVYRSTVDKNSTTTHRVVTKGWEDETVFTTKGDANQVRDPLPVGAHQLIGKVVFSVPYAGYLLYFAGPQKGKITLLGILLIFVSVELAKTLLGERKKEKEEVVGGTKAEEQVVVPLVVGQFGQN